MALVDYDSSAASDSDDQNTRSPTDTASARSLKRKRASKPLILAPVVQDSGSNALPPLPSSFHDMYASSTRASTHDDPSLHGGRKRAVPHVEGNWPSHVYLEWVPIAAEHTKLTRLLAAIKACSSKPRAGLTSLLTSTLAAPLPLHISLSAPLVVSTESKDSFLSMLRRRLPSLAPFVVSLGDADWVSNSEGTRRFLVLRCKKPACNELNMLLRWCNGVCRDSGLEELYVPNEDFRPEVSKRSKTKRTGVERARGDLSAKFHFSVAWCLANVDPVGLETKDAIGMGKWKENEDVKQALEEVQAIEVNFDVVKVKIGNVITSLALNERRHGDGRGILG